MRLNEKRSGIEKKNGMKKEDVLGLYLTRKYCGIKTIPTHDHTS